MADSVHHSKKRSMVFLLGLFLATRRRSHLGTQTLKLRLRMRWSKTHQGNNVRSIARLPWVDHLTNSNYWTPWWLSIFRSLNLPVPPGLLGIFGRAMERNYKRCTCVSSFARSLLIPCCHLTDYLQKLSQAKFLQDVLLHRFWFKSTIMCMCCTGLWKARPLTI